MRFENEFSRWNTFRNSENDQKNDPLESDHCNRSTSENADLCQEVARYALDRCWQFCKWLLNLTLLLTHTNRHFFANRRHHLHQRSRHGHHPHGQEQDPGDGACPSRPAALDICGTPTRRSTHTRLLQHQGQFYFVFFNWEWLFNLHQNTDRYIAISARVCG